MRDLALAASQFPGWAARLLTHPVQGLENYRQLIGTLTTAPGAIKVFLEIACVLNDFLGGGAGEVDGRESQHGGGVPVHQRNERGLVSGTEPIDDVSISLAPPAGIRWRQFVGVRHDRGRPLPRATTGAALGVNGHCAASLTLGPAETPPPEGTASGDSNQ